MIVRYEVVHGKDFVTVYACQHYGEKGEIVHVTKDSTLEHLAHEFFYVLAGLNNVPVVIRDID